MRGYLYCRQHGVLRVGNMAQDFASALDALVRRAPHDWLTSTCYALRCLPASAAADYALQSVPTTNNADLSFLMREIIGVASSRMSWEALSWAIETTSAIYHRCRAEQELELLWSGRSPAGQIPARRIDQALYDLIANANREILLVTFAASRINRLAGELMKAARRGVKSGWYWSLSNPPKANLATMRCGHFPQNSSARSR